MKKIVIDGFELNEEYTKMLLNELKDERVKTVGDLEKYVKGHTYMKNNATKHHLLMSKYPKKRNFAIPFEEENK